MTEDQTTDAITSWLKSRPGCFIERDEISVWRSAHRASGVECSPAFFHFTLSRIGHSIFRRGGYFILDLSDPYLVELAQ